MDDESQFWYWTTFGAAMILTSGIIAVLVFLWG
jgi:hypothetical protein